MEKNLTKGNPLKIMIGFSVPYFISYLLQTLYGLADLYIIGKFNGTECTAAVSVGSQIMHMLTVMLVGLAMGSTVMIARTVGAEDKKKTSVYTANSVILFSAVSITLTAVLLCLVKNVLYAVSTPPEAFKEAVSYLSICFAGIPFITAYNVISSIYRGTGDSKTPMYFIAVSCAANIALDYLFIGGMRLGAAGAALGTVLSQTLSVIIALLVIRNKKSGLKLSLKDFKPDKKALTDIFKIGFPIAVQDGFIQIAFLVITAIANSRGLNDAAAVGIVEKIIGIVFLIPSTMLSAVSAIAAQNVGANRHDRARTTLYHGIAIVILWGALVTVVTLFTAESCISLFTDNKSVIISGGQYMRGYIWDCIIAGTHFCFSGYFCAYGLSGISFAHNAVSIVFGRIPLAYLASKMYPDNLFPMGMATCLGSSISVFICLGVYLFLKKRSKQASQR